MRGSLTRKRSIKFRYLVYQPEQEKSYHDNKHRVYKHRRAFYQYFLVLRVPHLVSKIVGQVLQGCKNNITKNKTHAAAFIYGCLSISPFFNEPHMNQKADSRGQDPTADMKCC